jgi:hypothetical protein
MTRWSTFLHGPSMTSIVSLKLSRCWNVNDKGVEGIAARLNKLTFTCLHEVQVSVYGCEVSLSLCLYLQVHKLGRFRSHFQRLCNWRRHHYGDNTMQAAAQTEFERSNTNYRMCALREDPEPTFCFITLWCMIFVQQVRHWSQSPTIGQYCERV